MLERSRFIVSNLTLLFRPQEEQLAMRTGRIHMVHSTQLGRPFEHPVWKPNGVTTELAQFLLAAALINQSTLDSATVVLGNCGYTLSRYLLEHKLVSASDIFNALHSVAAVRASGVWRNSAVKALRLSVSTHQSFEHALTQLGVRYATNEQSIKLGRLLNSAGVVGDVDLFDAIETALTLESSSISTEQSASNNASTAQALHQTTPTRNTSLGNLLVERGLIRPDVLQSTLMVQSMLEQRSINSQLARELIQAVHSRHGTLQYCCAQLYAFSTAVLSLLVEAKLVSDIAIKPLLQSHFLDVPAILSENGYIDERAVNAARRFQEMVNKGLIKREQAIGILRQLDHTGLRVRYMECSE